MTIIMHRLIGSLLAVALAAPAASAQSTPDTSRSPARTPGDATDRRAPDGAEYRLGPGDRLRIEVYKEPQLSQSLQIRPDGQITMPLVGDLAASGLTPLDLRDRIVTALEEYMTSPVVTVIVVEANAAVAYVMGEVNRPGSIPLRGPTTVIQALAMAGGFSEGANTRNVRILRRNENNGRPEFITFNYRDALERRQPFRYLQPGDVVVVP